MARSDAPRVAARPPKRLLTTAVGIVALLAVTGSAGAARSALGKPVAPQTLLDLDGKKTPLIVPGTVNVLLFFSPTDAFSVDALRATAACRVALKDTDARWVLVVSGRHDKQAVRDALAQAEAPPPAPPGSPASPVPPGPPGAPAPPVPPAPPVLPTLPLVIDEGDLAYAALEVVVRPTAAIVDRKGVLSEWQAFEKIGFHDKLLAHVQHALGQLDDAGLERVLNPPRTAPPDAAVGRAARLVKLARALLHTKSLDKAEATARQALDADPRLAAAHATLGDVLAARGDCPAALKAFEAALGLDPADSSAAAGRAACREQPPSPTPQSPKTSPGDTP